MEEAVEASVASVYVLLKPAAGLLGSRVEPKGWFWFSGTAYPQGFILSAIGDSIVPEVEGITSEESGRAGTMLVLSVDTRSVAAFPAVVSVSAQNAMVYPVELFVPTEIVSLREL